MPAAQPHSVKQLGLLHHYTPITLTRALHQLYLPLRHLIKTYIKTLHKKNSMVAWQAYIFTLKKEISTY